MKVAFLTDAGNADGTLGGAEMTMAEFEAAAPDWVKVNDGGPPDRVILGNVVGYDEGLIPELPDRVVWYHNDLSQWINADLKAHLDQHAVHVFCSPLHQQAYRWIEGKPRESHLIPPPVDLEPFRQAASAANGRSGACSVAAWQNPAKAPHLAAEYAPDIDFYGGGPFAPKGSQPVAYQDMPELLARYETFVFLPVAVEPFGRLVAEAYAAGCRIVTNRLVGARYWLEERPEALRTAAEDFWGVVCG